MWLGRKLIWTKTLLERRISIYREEGELLASMADTRNDIYPSASSASSPNCESKDSTSKIVTVQVNSPESNGKDEKKDLESVKSFSSSSRPFISKSEANSPSSQRYGSSFGSKPFVLRQSAFGISKLGGGATPSSFTSSSKPLVLRPSQLAVSGPDTTQTSIAMSSESRINNPFGRVAPSAEESTVCNDLEKSSPETNASPEKNNQNSSSKQNASDASSHTVNNSSNLFLTSPKFVPLGIPVNQKDEPSSSGSNSLQGGSGFVFGQNLYERVEVTKTEIPEPSSSSKEVPEPIPCSSTSTNGTTSEMLFSSVIQKELATEDKSGSSSNDSGERPSKSLSEAAREYEEARAIKRKYEEVTVVTGEEDEANVLQLNCKLFAFDKPTSTWLERGRGNLRLNDMDGPEGLQSRVVVRTAGSLRVVLNTKIWAGMNVDRASAKSVRLTAMDNTGQVKVFLVMASPKEIEPLYHALVTRVTRKQQCKSSESRSLNSSQQSLDAKDTVPCSSSSPEPARKRPSLVQDAGGGSDSKM